MQRKLYLAMVLVIFWITQASSQTTVHISSGSNFQIVGTTNVFADSLVLKPSVDYNITGLNILTRNVMAAPPPSYTYVQRVFHWASALPAFSGSIGIYYRDDELNGLTENILALSVYDGNAWKLYNTNITRDAAINLVTAASLDGIIFKDATLAAVLNPLPVTLTSFLVQANQCHALLEWATATEQNSKHFEVQSSDDGTTFTTIGTIAATGNSSVEKKYSFTSPLPQGSIYFRLCIVDMDGETRYSAIKNVRNNCSTSSILVYPNPVKNILTVKGITPGSTLQLVTSSGQMMATRKVSGATEMINMSYLPAGNYILQVIQSNNQIENIKLIKE